MIESVEYLQVSGFAKHQKIDKRTYCNAQRQSAYHKQEPT